MDEQNPCALAAERAKFILRMQAQLEGVERLKARYVAGQITLGMFEERVGWAIEGEMATL